MSAVEQVHYPRAYAWRLLDRPLAWETLRFTLDAAFGLYRGRISLLTQWGVLDGAPSVLDVGCGIGQYCSVTSGPYLGVDMTERYIEHARRRHRHQTRREFRAANVTTLEAERQVFDIVLMVDFLHHLDDDLCENLLATAARLSRHYVISLEPVQEQQSRLGRWIIDHDRGDHMRSLARYHTLFERSPLSIERSEELHLGPINTRAVLASASVEQPQNAASHVPREQISER
jgi:SAM-dependent methyltransferase